MRDINIPMFTARGLAVRRANGEIVTPYYFAYEDLKEDWNKMLQECTKNQQSQQQQQGRAVEGKAKKGSKEIAMAMPPAVPKVLVKDFTEVMCLAKGITPDLIKPYTGAGSAECAGSMSTLTAFLLCLSRLVIPFVQYYMTWLCY